MSEWISVKDRLPEDGAPSLLFGVPCIGVVEGFRYKGRWFVLCDVRDKTPTHWMPLPEPPKDAYPFINQEE